MTEGQRDRKNDQGKRGTKNNRETMRQKKRLRDKETEKKTEGQRDRKNDQGKRGTKNNQGTETEKTTKGKRERKNESRSMRRPR